MHIVPHALACARTHTITNPPADSSLGPVGRGHRLFVTFCLYAFRCCRPRGKNAKKGKPSCWVSAPMTHRPTLRPADRRMGMDGDTQGGCCGGRAGRAHAAYSPARQYDDANPDFTLADDTL
jgi:hypothetical protein